MSRTGRPIALDARRRAAIADALGRGATVRSLAVVAGVSPQTLHSYLRRGLVTRPEPPPPPPVEAPVPEPEPMSLLDLLAEVDAKRDGLL